jgi:hypothetical protein
LAGEATTAVLTPSRQAAENGMQFLLLQNKPRRPLSFFAALRLGVRSPFPSAQDVTHPYGLQVVFTVIALVVAPTTAEATSAISTPLLKTRTRTASTYGRFWVAPLASWGRPLP